MGKRKQKALFEQKQTLLKSQTSSIQPQNSMTEFLVNQLNQLDQRNDFGLKYKVSETPHTTNISFELPSGSFNNSSQTPGLKGLSNTNSALLDSIVQEAINNPSIGSATYTQQDKSLKNIISSITQMMQGASNVAAQTGQTQSISATFQNMGDGTLNFTELLTRDPNLKNLFDRGVFPQSSESSNSECGQNHNKNFSSQINQGNNCHGPKCNKKNCMTRVVVGCCSTSDSAYSSKTDFGEKNKQSLIDALNQSSQSPFSQNWHNAFNTQQKTPFMQQVNPNYQLETQDLKAQAPKQRQIKTLYDCSPTLQSIFTENPFPASTKTQKQQPKEKNLSQIKQDIQKLEQWSKGSEQMTQYRQLCYHQAYPQVKIAENLLKEYQISDPRTFFVVNDYLWVTQRPQRLQVQQITYGFSESVRSPFQLMIDVNRCLILTTQGPMQKLRNDSKFELMLTDVCQITPAQFEDRVTNGIKKIKELEIFVRNHSDSSVSIEQERRSLTYALLNQTQQVRGLLYYRLLKCMVVVGHHDIECCFLMPSETERVNGILADDYYQSFIKLHSHKIERRRAKLIKYLQYSFETFQRSCNKLIRTGVMDRLFKHFDFFNFQDRDQLNPQARRFMRAKKQPKVSQQIVDEFGDTTYSFLGLDLDSEDENEENWMLNTEDGITRFSAESDVDDFCSDSESEFSGKSAPPKQHNYEVFIMGFFYFFVLQDPFIIQYLDQKNIKFESELKAYKSNLLEDIHIFQKQYMTQWVHIMVHLEVFESTAIFGKQYSNGLSYVLHKHYYENLKIAQHFRMTKFDDENQDLVELKKITTAKVQTQTAADMPFLRKMATDSTGFTNPFNCKVIPTFLQTKELTMASLRKQVEQYLCDYCCSHRITKFQSTLNNSVDIVMCFVGNQPSVTLPPSISGQENFIYQSFTCSCDRKSMLCQTDINGQQRQLNKLPEDRQLFELMRVGAGMVYRHQKVLQVKVVEPMPDLSDSDEMEEVRQFTNFNEQLLKELISGGPTVLQATESASNKEEPIITEDEIIKKKRKKRRRKGKGKVEASLETITDGREGEPTADSQSSQIEAQEPIDNELEIELMLFKQRLEVAPSDLYPFMCSTGQRKRANVSEQWLSQLKQRLGVKV